MDFRKPSEASVSKRSSVNEAVLPGDGPVENTSLARGWRAFGLVPARLARGVRIGLGGRG